MITDTYKLIAKKMQFFNLLTELNDLAVVLLYVVCSKAVRHGGGTGQQGMIRSPHG